MGLTNHEEVQDFVLACQDVDALRVYQHMINERLAMFGDPQKAIQDQHFLHERPHVLLPENAGVADQRPEGPRPPSEGPAKPALGPKPPDKGKR